MFGVPGLGFRGVQGLDGKLQKGWSILIPVAQKVLEGIPALTILTPCSNLLEFKFAVRDSGRNSVMKTS